MFVVTRADSENDFVQMAATQANGMPLNYLAAYECDTAIWLTIMRNTLNNGDCSRLSTASQQLCRLRSRSGFRLATSSQRVARQCYRFPDYWHRRQLTENERLVS